MSNSRRIFSQRFFILLGSLLLGGLALIVALTFMYRNTVGQLIINRLSEHISTPFEAESVSLSIFTKPFKLTLTLHDFKVEKQPQTNPKELIAQAEALHFTLDVVDLLNGRYNIEEVYVENAQINYTIDKNAKTNDENVFALNLPANPKAKVQFKVNTIYLQNVKIYYQNQSQKEKASVVFTDTKVSFLGFKGVVLQSQIQGTLQNLHIEANEFNLLHYPTSNFAVTMAYDPAQEKILFEKGKLKFRESAFIWKGTYQFEDKKEDFVQIEFQGEEQNLSSLVAILPEEWYEKLIDYKSEGNITFKGKIEGEWGKEIFPAFRIDFEAQNIALRSPNITQSLENVTFKGSISNGEAHNLKTTFVRISEIAGKLNGRRFAAHLDISDWLDPYVAFRLEAGINLGDLLEFFPVDAIEKAKGFVGIDLTFEGKISALKENQHQQNIKSSGDLQLKQVTFNLAQRPLLFEGFDGDFTFKDNLLIINQIKGNAGNSDFQFKGEAYNFLAYIFLPDGKFSVKGEWFSQKIDLEQLLKHQGISIDNQMRQVRRHQYLFSLSPQISCKIHLKADSLIFRNFKAQDIQADFVLKEQILRTSNLSLQLAGGTLSLLGIVNAQKSDFIRFDGRFFFKNMQTDKLLTAFENFSQTLIQPSQIRGLLDADWQSAFVFNRYLEFDLKHLVASIDVKIRKGKLQSFAPWQRIAQFLRTKNLRLEEQLAFEELNQQVQIRNQMVFVPEMEIITAKEKFSIVGRSSFEQDIDYRLRIPMQTKNTKNDVFYLSLQGSFENLRPSFLEFPNMKTLEQNWVRERKSLLVLFDETPIQERKINIDTVETAFFEF